MAGAGKDFKFLHFNAQKRHDETYGAYDRLIELRIVQLIYDYKIYRCDKLSRDQICFR